MKKILITRPRSQSDQFANLLARAGFEPIIFPVIEILPLEDISALISASYDLSLYRWAIFTSVNTVQIVFSHAEIAESIRNAEIKIAAIGAKTAEALKECGIHISFVPDEYISTAILPGLGDLQGVHILYPCAEAVRDELPDAIEDAGGIVHKIPVYKTVPAPIDPASLNQLRTGVNMVVFSSPSTVENFIQVLKKFDIDPLNLPGSPTVACIGPVTSFVARQAGFNVAFVPQDHTIDGLVKAIGDYYVERNK